MQYATATNNIRTAGGSIGRQGRVSFALIFNDDFSLLLCF
jgi:hypothetical protein